LREVISSAHPSKESSSSSEFRLCDPKLHIAEERSEPMSAEEKCCEDKCRILFVGCSDLLAEIHYSTCKRTGPLIGYRIDSVSDFASFKEWYKVNSKLVSDPSARIMIVSSCQSDDSDCTMAEQVHSQLMQDFREHIGFAIACCPFLSHGPEQMHRFKCELSTSVLKYVTMSSDGKRLAEFIHNAFTKALARPAGDSSGAVMGSFITGKAKTGRFAKLKEAGKTKKATA